MINVAFLGTLFKEKRPSISVTAPSWVPFTRIDAPIIGSPLASIMIPVHWLETYSMELTPSTRGVAGDALA